MVMPCAVTAAHQEDHHHGACQREREEQGSLQWHPDEQQCGKQARAAEQHVPQVVGVHCPHLLVLTDVRCR
jgi:hypothetical protein